MMAALVLSLSACFAGGVPPTPVSPRPLGQELPVFAPPPRDAPRPADFPIQTSTDSIALGEALRHALMHNPGLQALAWETLARESAARQAARWPNPDLGVLVEDVGASGAAGTPGAAAGIQPQTTVQLSQLIELGRKRGLRRTLAATDRDLAEWDLEVARLDVLTRVRHAFIDVLTAQEVVTLTSRTVQLVDSVHRRVRDRVTAGAVSPIEETRAGVALATAQLEAHRATRTLEANRRGLAALWGATEATFAGATGVLEVADALPAFEALAARLGENPAVARSAAEVLRQRATLSAEGARRVPDLTVTGGVRRFPDLGGSALVIGGSLALPLFDRNGDAIAAARSRVERALAEQRDVEARASARLASAYSALSAAREEASMLRATVLPGAERAFAAVSEGYRLGRFGYLEVLDAQRTLIATNSQYLRALAEYHKAVADVEQIVGAPLDTVPAVPR